MGDNSSIFGPASSSAEAIMDLFTLLTIFSSVILAIVVGGTLYSAFRFRERTNQDEPRQIFGHIKLEMTWTLAAALLVLIIAIFTFNTMSAVNLPASQRGGTEQPDIIITGHQWWWEVEYTQADFITANEIHIPVGQTFLVQLESADVIHSFWVPKLGRKMDAVPGHTNHLWLEANEEGIYLGTCSEFCGTQHAWMRLRVIAQPPADYAVWEKAQQQTSSSSTEPLALQGAQRFQELTCVNCHAIAGTPAQATAGPNLTHFASRQTLGAGVLENNTTNLTRWLTNPQTVKPGNQMPHFQLSSTDLKTLVAYLETLK